MMHTAFEPGKALETLRATGHATIYVGVDAEDVSDESVRLVMISGVRTCSDLVAGIFHGQRELSIQIRYRFSLKPNGDYYGFADVDVSPVTVNQEEEAS